MANKLITNWCMLSDIIMVILFSSLLHWVEAQPQTPCFFIFGDSVVDNGNNNDLDTTAKCNYPPYGLDFPTGQPTGRFCNGRTIVDITAELLGFSNYMPPFADTSGADILLGVNYASAGAGIRYETGKNLGEIRSFDEQLENHQTIISQMNDIIGSSESTFEYLNKCLYYLGMGGNDYMNNYLLTKNYTYTPEEFADLLIQQYSDQLESLYESGARKFALYSVGAAGCIPYVIGTSGTDGSLCSELYNSPIRIFNEKLKSLVDDLNNNFNDAHFIYVNIYDLTFELVEDPSSFGFTVIDTSCCGNGNKNSLPCEPLQIPCANRDEYLYWDPYHLSEAANVIITQRTYHAQTETDTYPMDIFTLAQL